MTSHDASRTTTIDRATPYELLPVYLSVSELQDYLDIGRSTAYAFAREHGIRIGKLVRVPRESLRNCA